MDTLGIPSQTWFPVVTLIIGLALKAIFDALTDRRTFRREREARKEQRLDTIRQTRVEFQRATLLELQNTVSQLARFIGQTHHQDTMAYLESGVWQKQLLTEEVNIGILHANTSLRELRVRVRDEDVRRISKDFSSKCTSVALSPNETDAKNAFSRLTVIADELSERVGVVLRSLDDDEDKIS
ncbi:MAG: hypothetical protein ISR47_10105 [Rhodospirillales bacterium]|nr:hypothetical protein [Rhodospirillales bacterium]